MPFSFETDGDLRVAASVTPSANATVDLNLIRGSAAQNVGGALAVSGQTSNGLSIQGNVSGVPVKVEFLTSSVLTTVSTALPAGTNAIGKLAANDGVDIGDVTINNASGGSAVNIQDGGNSITVDGTVSVGNTVNVNFLTSAITVTDGAGSLNTILDSGTLTSITNAVAVTDNSGSLTVDFAGVAPTTVYNGAQATVLANTTGTSGIVGGVNTAQIAGVTPVMVSGAQAVVLQQTSGTGSIGVMTVTSGINTGASVSTVQPVYIAGNGSGNLNPLIVCDQAVTISQASSGTTQLVASSTNKKIYICSFDLFAAGTVNVQLEDGTTAGAGIGCTGGTTRVTGFYNFTAQTGIAKGSGVGIVAKPSQLSAALCIRTSAAVQVDGTVEYTQFGLGWLSVLTLIVLRKRWPNKSLF